MFTLVKCRQFAEITVCAMLMLLLSLLLLLRFSCTWAYLVTAWQQPAQVNTWGSGPYIQYSNGQPPGTWNYFWQTQLLCLRKTTLSWSRLIGLYTTGALRLHLLQSSSQLEDGIVSYAYNYINLELGTLMLQVDVESKWKAGRWYDKHL